MALCFAFNLCATTIPVWQLTLRLGSINFRATDVRFDRRSARVASPHHASVPAPSSPELEGQGRLRGGVGG